MECWKNEDWNVGRIWETGRLEFWKILSERGLALANPAILDRWNLENSCPSGVSLLLPLRNLFVGRLE
jgi:hypothetical protein